mmetsp:Transcript_32893/g.42447  ORF Transcript_32893/g.42447 Transcript_32893/m.42447 type:complete len:104 (+) Transcript_32893:525-836(+)
MDGSLRGLHGIELVVNRTCGASEVVDLINLHKQWKRHIMAQEFKSLIVQQMRDVGARSRKEVVDAKDFIVLCNQLLTQVTANKSGPAGHQYSIDQMHFIATPC